MNLRQLHIFSCIAKHGSITKAAQELYMTQPALSHALKDLENEVHTTLFDRIGKRLVLNRQGAYILKKTDVVLQSFSELEGSIRDVDKKAVFKIGSCITIAGYHLPPVLQVFHLQYPELPVQVDVNSAREIFVKLKQKQIDLALMEGIISDEDVTCYPFGQYQLVVICANDHPLTKKEKVPLKELLQETWLLREQGSAVRDTFDALLQVHGYHIQPYWTSVNSQALLQAVQHNLGISILPEAVVKQSVKKGNVHCLRLEEGPLYNDMQMVQVKGKTLSESEQALLTLLQNHNLLQSE